MNTGDSCSAGATGDWRDVTGNSSISSHKHKPKTSRSQLGVVIWFRGITCVTVVTCSEISNRAFYPELARMGNSNAFQPSSAELAVGPKFKSLPVLTLRDSHPSLAFECLMRLARLWSSPPPLLIHCSSLCPSSALPRYYRSSANWLLSVKTCRSEFPPKIFLQCSHSEIWSPGSSAVICPFSSRTMGSLLEVLGTRSWVQPQLVVRGVGWEKNIPYLFLAARLAFLSFRVGGSSFWDLPSLTSLWRSSSLCYLQSHLMGHPWGTASLVFKNQNSALPKHTLPSGHR